MAADLHKITNSQGSKNPTRSNSLRGNLDLKGRPTLPGEAGNKTRPMVNNSVQDDTSLVLLGMQGSVGLNALGKLGLKLFSCQNVTVLPACREDLGWASLPPRIALLPSAVIEMFDCALAVAVGLRNIIGPESPLFEPGGWIAKAVEPDHPTCKTCRNCSFRKLLDGVPLGVPGPGNGLDVGVPLMDHPSIGLSCCSLCPFCLSPGPSLCWVILSSHRRQVGGSGLAVLEGVRGWTETFHQLVQVEKQPDRGVG
jgi:hypothetical protein